MMETPFDAYLEEYSSKIEALAQYELAMRRLKEIKDDPDEKEWLIEGATWAFQVLKKAIIAELENPEPKSE